MDSTTMPPQVGEIIEKGQQAALNSAKTVVSDVSNTVSDQVGLKNEVNFQTPQQAQTAPASEPQNNATGEVDMTREVVSDYYSPSQTQFNTQQAELEEQQRQTQLAQVRQELHQQLHNEVYFNDVLTAGATKPQVQSSEQEEVQQKQMEDLQTAQKKNEDIARFKAERQVEIKGDVVG